MGNRRALEVAATAGCRGTRDRVLETLLALARRWVENMRVAEDANDAGAVG